MVNILFICVGIGICMMSILQILFGTRLTKEVKTYFLLFFETILLYICNHLLRQLMDGAPGGTIRFWIHLVTFFEFVASGIMAWLFSMLTLFVAKTEERARLFATFLHLILAIHVIVMVVSQFSDLCYYFDESNSYHRSSGYILSNISILLMLLFDIYLLIRYRSNFSKRIRLAFWVYIISPSVAIIIQSIYSEIQFIIAATVLSAVYMTAVIMGDIIVRFEQQQAKSSRIETELNMATDIQASQLPRLFPAFPQRDEFDLFASMTPAKEVGGDFYDFFLVDDDHIGLVMADVSGKGVPAALFMMIARVLIKTHLQNGESPGEALKNVNEQLCEGNEAELFVTVWTAVLEISTGKGIAANAGHEHPALRRAGSGFELVTYRHSPAVATMEGINFKEHEFVLFPGDSLFVYTDGVTEATNSNNELLGTDRMIEALNKNPDASPEEVLSNAMAGIQAFVGSAEQFDDITMLCIKYNGTR
jgi:serine phosphatase RsbU (regulator of sigma subunit)